MYLRLYSHSQETASGAHHFHPHPAGHPGGPVLQDALPGHLHEGGGGSEDQPARVPCPGTAAPGPLKCPMISY